MSDFKLTNSDKYLAISRSKQIFLDADEQRQTLDAILAAMSPEERQAVLWRELELVAGVQGVEVAHSRSATVCKLGPYHEIFVLENMEEDEFEYRVLLYAKGRSEFLAENRKQEAQQ